MPRTIVDIPAAQLEEIDAMCGRLRISRAEAVRRALQAYLDRRVESDTAAGFGLWRGPVDGQAGTGTCTGTGAVAGTGTGMSAGAVAGEADVARAAQRSAMVGAVGAVGTIDLGDAVDVHAARESAS